LSVNDGDRAERLAALDIAQPRQQHVKHTTDVIHGVYPPAIHALVRTDLLVGTVDTAERNAPLKADELLGDH
jgi:hypothetical protein